MVNCFPKTMHEAMVNQSTQGEAVTHPADILRLLRSLQRDAIAVTVVFTQSQRSLSSYVIDVDADTGLTLDEPLPRAMAREWAGGVEFMLEAEVDGVMIRAPELAIRATVSDGDETHFQCALPGVIYSTQRRRSYRAQVRRSLMIEAHVRSDEGADESGWLRDLSVDGCGIEINQDAKEQFPELGVSLTIELTFPNQSRLEYPAILQRVNTSGDSGTTTLGCRLTEMPAQQQTAVAALVTDLQRDQINLRKKGGSREDIPERFLSPEGETVSTPSERSSPATRRSGKKPSRAQAGKDEPQESVETAWRNALAAVRRQQQQSRAEPAPDLAEAVKRLSRCWQRQREPLLVYSRIRSADNTDVEQRTSNAMILADHAACQVDGSVKVFAERLMQGLLKRLPEAERPMAQLIAAQDALAYRIVDGSVYFHPTAALGVLHRKERFDASLIRTLMGTQGLHSLGSAVRLSDGTIALVMRQGPDGRPLWVRQVYRISEQSPLPPKDLSLDGDGPSVEGPADPVKADLPVDLLRPALRR